MTNFRLIIAFFLFASTLFSSCSDTVKIRFMQPAKVPLDGINTIGVSKFEVVESTKTLISENAGEWRRASLNSSGYNLETEVQNLILNKLSRFSQFQNIHLTRFRKVRSGKFSTLIPVSGEIRPKIDAILTGKIFIHITEQKGVEYRKITLRDYKEKLLNRSGKRKLVVVANSSKDELTGFPYRIISGSIILSMNLVKTGESSPAKLAHVTIPLTKMIKYGGYNQEVIKFGDEQDFDEIFEQIPEKDKEFFPEFKDSGSLLSFFRGKSKKKIVSAEKLSLMRGEELSEYGKVPPELIFSSLVVDKAVEQFLPYLMISSREEERIIIKDGDKIAENMIRARAIDHAIKRLEKVISSGEATAPNKYLLALCYEISGELLAAKESYDEALTLDPDNKVFLNSMGNIEQRLTENKRLRKQLLSIQENQNK